VFADTWPGKFTDLEAAISLLNTGGVYVIDDLLQQPSWPVEHGPKIPRLMEELARREDLALWPMVWDTGIVVAVKKG
jgi:predicted O-methyltransferase YrrM